VFVLAERRTTYWNPDPASPVSAYHDVEYLPADSGNSRDERTDSVHPRGSIWRNTIPVFSRHNQPDHDRGGYAFVLAKPSPHPLWQQIRFNKDRPYRYDSCMTLSYLLLGLIIGAISGIVGTGGGVLIVPALVYFFHMSQHKAQGTSLGALLAPIGILAFWEYHKAGNVDLKASLFDRRGFCPLEAIWRVLGATTSRSFAPRGYWERCWW